MKKIFLTVAIFFLTFAENKIANAQSSVPAYPYTYNPSYSNPNPVYEKPAAQVNPSYSNDNSRPIYQNNQNNQNRNGYAAKTSFVKDDAVNRSSFYFGADWLRSNVGHEYPLARNTNDSYASSITTHPHTFKRNDNGRSGFGINAGYRAALGSAVFVAPELFYEYIGSTSKDFYYDDPALPAPNDKMKVKSRYGVKLNLGYNLSNLAEMAGLDNGFGKFLSDISITGSAGIARVSYGYDLPSIADASSSGRPHTSLSTQYPSKTFNKFAPIFGVGINYAITNHVMLKISADMQKFDGVYLDKGLTDTITIKTAKVGLAYYF